MTSAALTSRLRRSGALFVAALLLLALGASSAGCKKPQDLPSLGQVGAFSLLDQNSAALSTDALRGKVWVAAFFFTRCPTICPRITRRMRALQVAAARQVPALALVSFSVDP